MHGPMNIKLKKNTL